MGEHLSQHDPHEPDGALLLAKLGTADDFRYIRRTEIERLAGGRLDHLGMAREGLTDSSTLYRFPWPDEDTTPFDTLDGRDDMFRTRTIAAPFALDFIEHKDRWLSMSPDHGAYNVNVAVPCPAGKKFGALGLVSSPVPTGILQIYGERYDTQGRGRTIYRCGYCEVPFSLDDDATVAVVEVLRRHGLGALAERLRAVP